jgi:glycogen debranching enzyme
VLTSFARFQDLDRASRFYGRLPNIVKPGSVDYHTTDGTPRWVLALRDYVRYTGDRSAVAELYPNVAASIEGSLARWTDSAGYLVHADNETWMDARREPDKAAYAPRATRANDVQALWHGQLRAGAEFAALTGRAADAARWSRAADRLRARFARDFVEPGSGRVADHLDARGAADYTLRPNLLFALDLVPDSLAAARAARRAWEGLVYPWGTSTLDAADPNFHPYHLAWEHYHKDEAYHNGTVWPWLDGIAMQRMIERGQIELAWRLFRRTATMALARGAVGGLPETMDAYPHPGEAAPRLTGTFLQAWSNAEYLRVWSEQILGVRPDLGRAAVVLAPRMPAALSDAEFAVRVGAGLLRARYDRPGGVRRYAYQLTGQAAALTLDLAPHAPRTFSAAPGDSLVAEVRADGVHARLVAPNGAVRASAVLAATADRLAARAALDGVLAGTRFAAPRPVEAHAVLRQVYRRGGP